MDTFIGICTVCAHYKRNKMVESSIESNASIDEKNFSFPHEYEIVASKCTGHIKLIGGRSYVITCDHIIKNNDNIAVEYKAHLFDVNNSITTITLTLHARIYELDIAIFYIGDEKHIGAELTYANTIEKTYPNGSNSLVIGEYDKMICELVDGDIVLEFDTINSTAITDLPCLTFLRRHVTGSSDVNVYKGLSGAIIQNNLPNVGVTNIGMVLMCVIKHTCMYVKALPLAFIDLMVTQFIKLKLCSLIGIHVTTARCDIDYENKPLVGRFVVGRTCMYKNKRNNFRFHKGDIIVKVDDVVFDAESKLYTKLLNCCVPLHTFLLLQSMQNKHVNITIIKSHIQNPVPKSYMIKSKQYDKMFMHHTLPTRHSLEWNGQTFAELSDEIYCRYQTKCNEKIFLMEKMRDYAVWNEKYVVLLNCIIGHKTACIVEKIGNKQINKLTDVATIINQHRKHDKLVVNLLDGEDGHSFKITYHKRNNY